MESVTIGSRKIFNDNILVCIGFDKYGIPIWVTEEYWGEIKNK